MNMKVRVGDRWLDELGPWGDLAYSLRADGGCDTASWTVGSREILQSPALRRGRPVRIGIHGYGLWVGMVSETDPDDLQVHAVGLAKQAERTICISGTDISSNPHAVVTAAIARGALTWTYRGGLPNTNFRESGDNRTFSYVNELLDAVVVERGERWGVDGRGVFYMAPDPTVPKWDLAEEPVAGVADDSYVTHVYGRYRSGDTGSLTTPSVDTRAEGRWLRSEALIDGFDSQWGFGRAKNAADAAIAKGAGRLVHTQAYEVDGSNLSAGGVGAALHLVEPRQVVRMPGTVDAAGVYQLGATHDFVIGRVEFRTGQPMVITPVGAASRDLQSILSAPEPRETV